MARILRSEQAPDGQPLAAAFGMYRFDAGDADYFETDDAALLAEADNHPYFTVEYEVTDGGVAQAEAAQAERDRIAAGKEHDALKDAREPNHLALMDEQEEEVQETKPRTRKVTPPSDNAPAPQTAAHEKTEEARG